MDALTLSQLIFLNKLIAAYERERQFDHPAYHDALAELARLQAQQDTQDEQRPASNISGAF